MQPRGVCFLCGSSRTFSVSGAVKHVAAHWKEAPGSGKPPFFWISLRARSHALYWMEIGIRADAPLSLLDAFLRAAWVECCEDHVSGFQIGDRQFFSDQNFAEEDLSGSAEPEEGRPVQLNEVMKVGDAFLYTFDYGTPTEVEGNVRGVFHEIQGAKHVPELWRGGVLVAMRNLKPVFACEVCGQRAEHLLVRAPWDRTFRCEAHREDPETAHPLFNAPRSGVCGYDGPSPDLAFEVYDPNEVLSKP